MGRRRLDLWQLGGDFRKDLGFWMLKDDSDHLRAAVEPVCCHGGTSERWSAGTAELQASYLIGSFWGNF